MERTCPQGHVVTDDYLRACPACGAQLVGATGRNPSLAPDRDVVQAPRTVPFLVGAVVLAAFGWLLAAAAQEGPAEWFGWLLVAAAVVVAVVGVLPRRS